MAVAHPQPGSSPEPAPDSTADGAARLNAQRRRVVVPGEGGAPDPSRQGRTGCLLLGAVLGVIVGLGFALYGLKPILKHFYGEQTVAAGQAYAGDAKTIRVTYAGMVPDPALGGFTSPASGSYYVTVAVTTNKTWAPKVSDFSVQFAGVNHWQPAVQAPGLGAADALVLKLATNQLVELRFSLPTGSATATATYLHIVDPRVRMALPPP